MYKNIVFDFGGVMVDFDPHEYLVDLFGNHGGGGGGLCPDLRQ